MSLRRIILALTMAAGLALAASPAVALAHPPHQEETDGCDHGHTGRPCRPDPQPTHGKDCLLHGRHGGINEDHCLSTTTTTSEVTTSTTGPTTTTTTTASSPTTSTSTPKETTTSLLPVITTTSSTAPLTTTEQTTPTTSTTTLAPAASPTTELAHTGRALDALFALGLFLLLSGLGFLFIDLIMDLKVRREEDLDPETFDEITKDLED